VNFDLFENTHFLQTHVDAEAWRQQPD